MPTFPLDSKTVDGTRLAVELNFARKFVGIPVKERGRRRKKVGSDVSRELEEDWSCQPPPGEVMFVRSEFATSCGLANANADAGIPPSVSASAAFNAYG